MGDDSTEKAAEVSESDEDSPSEAAPHSESAVESGERPGDSNWHVESTRTGSVGSGASVQRSTNGETGAGAATGHTYTDYDAGPNHQALSERYGLDFCKRGQAQKVQRLESEFGSDRVSRWTDEGMTVETMGKPQDMQAFRERKAERSEEIPADIERQNQASFQRNVHRSTDESGEVGSAVEHLHSVGELRAKLAISSPNDPAEKEAEQVAAEVMKMDEPQAGGETTAGGERQRHREGETDSLQRSISTYRSAEGGAVADGAEKTVQSALSGGGKSLSSETRSYFEPRFGTDFSDVTVHTGSQADEAARSINAEAFTMGDDIAFAKGNYEPDSSSGKELIAHELTHVVQQDGASRKGAQRLSAGPVDIDYEVTDIGDIFSVWVEDIPETQAQEVGGSKRLVVEVNIEGEISAELDFEREGGANATAGMEASGEASGGANLRIERILGTESEVDQYIEDLRRIASGESPDALESGWEALEEIGDAVQDDPTALAEAVGDQDGMLEGAMDAGEEMLAQARQRIANVGQELQVLIGSAKHLRAGDVNELFLHAAVAGELAGNASAGLSLGEAEASLGPSFDVEGSVEWHRIVRAEGLGGGKTALTIEFFKETESEGSVSLVEGTIELDDETIASFDVPVADARGMASERYMNMFVLDHDPDAYDFGEVFWNIATLPSRSSLNDIKGQSPYGDLLVESEEEIAEVSELGWSPTLELDDGEVELFHGTQISVEGERIINEDGMEIGYVGSHEQSQGLTLEIEDEDDESREFSASSTQETVAEVLGDEEGISVDARNIEESEGILPAIRSMGPSNFEDAVNELLDGGTVAGAAEVLLYAHEVRIEGYDVDRDEMRTVVGRATRTEGGEWNSYARFTAHENDWRELGEELANPTVTESDYRDIPGDIDGETREELETGLRWDRRARAIAEYFSETGDSGMVPWEKALMGTGGNDTIGFRYANVEDIEDILSEYRGLVEDVEEFVQNMRAIARTGARVNGELDDAMSEQLSGRQSDLIGAIESTKEAIEADDGTNPGVEASMIQSLNQLQIEVESAYQLYSGDETTDADIRRVIADEIAIRSYTLQTFQDIEAENIEGTEGRGWRMWLHAQGLSGAISIMREQLLLGSSERFYNDWADEIELYWDAWEALDNDIDIHQRVRPYTPDFVALGRAMDEALPGGWEGDPRTGDKLRLFEEYHADEDYSRIVSQLRAIAGV